MEPFRYFLQIVVVILLVNGSRSFNIDDNCPRIFHQVFNGYAPIGKIFSIFTGPAKLSIVDDSTMKNFLRFFGSDKDASSNSLIISTHLYRMVYLSADFDKKTLLRHKNVNEFSQPTKLFL